MKPADLLPLVTRYANTWPRSLVMAIAEKESGRHNAAGELVDFDECAFAIDRNGGSYGLFQIDVPTARDRGFRGKPTDLFDPPQNTQLAVMQFDWIGGFLKRRGALGLQAVIAAYNEGVGNVLKGNPDPRYVGEVMNYRTRWMVALGEGVA